MVTTEALGAHEHAPNVMPLRRDDLVLEELDGEAILYDPRYGSIHRFNAVTLFVWDMCDGTHTAVHITQRIAQLCEVGPDEALDNVQRAIAELRTLDLLKEGPAVSKGKRPVDEPLEMRRDGTSPPGWAQVMPQPVASSVTPTDGQPLRLSRRELLGGGVAKLIFVAPVISTFFAARAYANASNPIAPGSPFGGGGCKNLGFSCTVNGDCCSGECDVDICTDDPTCQGVGELCFVDEDCCSDDCDMGTCQ